MRIGEHISLSFFNLIDSFSALKLRVACGLNLLRRYMQISQLIVAIHCKCDADILLMKLKQPEIGKSYQTIEVNRCDQIF